MNRLGELLVATGFVGEDSADGIVRTLDKIDRAELVAAIQNGTGPASVDTEALPLAVSAIEAQPPEQPSFLINGFLLASEIHLLVSDGGVGKTTLALAIATSVASGRELFECESFKVNTPGPVLIVSEEDGLGVLKNRLEAIVRGHGYGWEHVLSRVHLIAQEGASLDDPAWRAHILSETERIGARLVILDPWAELTLAEENSNTDTKPLVRYLREITTKTGAAVLVLHHATKPADGKSKIHRVRGATALAAAARGIWFLDDMEIGISLECLKMSRSEKPRKFVVKREIESDPKNRAIWANARLTYATQTEAEDQAAERFVLEQLTRRGTLKSTEIRVLAKGTGSSAVDVSMAIKNLSAIGKIAYNEGPRNARNWYLCDPAQKSRQAGQATLPTLPDPARQAEEASPVVAPLGEGATGAGTGGQSGNQNELPWDDDSLLYERDEREGMAEA